MSKPTKKMPSQSSEPQYQAFTTDVFATGNIYATASATAKGFHYTLSLMQDQTTCTKYHAKEPSANEFIFESATEMLAKSKTLCVAVKIGETDQGDEELEKLLKAIPMTLPDCDQVTDGYFRCRVWLKQAIRTLNDVGIISCSDADAVVNGELRKLAEANSDSIKLGTGGPKVYTSQYSV